MVTCYSHPVFLTLVPVPSVYHVSNGEIPSVKPGFFQPISGPLPITQHLKENACDMASLMPGHASKRDVSNKRDD